MCRILGALAFLVFIVSNAAFSFNWGGCNETVYLIQSGQKYAYGELFYQLGASVGVFILFIPLRLSAKKWQWKLVYNWVLETYLIVIWFTLFYNPYALNWDKFLFLSISMAGLAVLYITCFLFPFFRRLII